MSQIHYSLLSGNEAHLFRLLDSIVDYAIYAMDVDGTILSWNRGAEGIKGYKSSEIIGVNFSCFYSPEDVDRGLPGLALQKATKEGRFSCEGWRIRKNGSRFWASVVIDPILENGVLVGFVKITRDVTDRYEASLQLQAAKRALLASQKFENIGKLTLGLAHDFNNLLTVIINSLDMIGFRYPSDTELQALCAVANRSADHGSLLTRQLLAFGRGNNFVAHRTSLQSALSKSSEILMRACGDTRVLSIHDNGDEIYAWVDVTQLEAAILNLVINARDATAEFGVIKIELSLQSRVSPDDLHGAIRKYAAVEVSDNGSGMSAELIERAGEPFYTTKEVGQGSGLGLSQVFGFASQSGGFVDIKSVLGSGTRVTIFLPVEEYELEKRP